MKDRNTFLLCLAGWLLIWLGHGCVNARAQSEDVYLYVRSVDTLTNKLAQINAALGYPSPATKTERAIDYTILSNGTNAVIRIDPSAVWSPKHNRYVDWAAKVKEQLTEAQWGVAVVDTLSELQAVRKTNAPVARITGRLLRQVGEKLGETTATVEAPK